MNTNILMIEDDAELAGLLTNFLLRYNIKVQNYEDPYLGISALDIGNFDLLILDLSLPGMDGLDICKEVREKSNIPIIISSARSDVDDKIIGLMLGADDYLPKPYEPKELHARIISVLRRYQNRDDKQQKEEVLKLDKDAMAVSFFGNNLDLTKAEYEILSHLIEKKNCAISRVELINHSVSLDDEKQSRSLDVIISRIRQKLGESSKNPKYIHSIRGIGYRLQY
ncbi:MAG: response regulator transcription factor [Epsilonproteobacteria bacterium]|nr:response regulator transcription factor [Campylobacterota bacterium]